MSYSVYRIGTQTVRCTDERGNVYTIDFPQPLKEYYLSGDNIIGHTISGANTPIITHREVTYNIRTNGIVDSSTWIEHNEDNIHNSSNSRFAPINRPLPKVDPTSGVATVAHIIEVFKIVGVTAFFIYVAYEVFQRI